MIRKVHSAPASISSGSSNGLSPLRRRSAPRPATPQVRRSFELSSRAVACACRIKVVTASCCNAGAAIFHGLLLAPGGAVSAPLPRWGARRMELVGSSTEIGYGVEGTFPCSFTAQTENGAKSWAAYLANALNAGSGWAMAACGPWQHVGHGSVWPMTACGPQQRAAHGSSWPSANAKGRAGSAGGTGRSYCRIGGCL
jgi:hypothetical protein